MTATTDRDTVLHWAVRCRKCGRIVAVASGDPRFANEAARSVADWIREGEAVERVDGGAVRRDGIDHGPECSAGKQLGLGLEG